MKKRTAKQASVDIVVEVSEEEVVEPAQDYLMWIGSEFYPTVDVYIAEARKQGCCKRIGKAPTQLVPGLSRVFLAHDDGLVGDGFVFGFYVVEQIQVLIQYLEDLSGGVRDNVTPVLIEDMNEDDRLCGERNQVGSFYLVGAKVLDPTQPSDLVVFDSFRRLNRFDYGRKRFRGALRIDYGDSLTFATESEDLMQAPSRSAKSTKTWAPGAIYNEWNIQQDIELAMRMDAGESYSRVAREMSLETGRPKEQILYRYGRIRKNKVEVGNVWLLPYRDAKEG